MSGNTSFMKKISGTITNTPPPLPKDGNMYHMAVRSGSPIEGVKITETRINHKKNGKTSRPLQLLIKAYILMIFKYKYLKNLLEKRILLII